MKPQPEIDQEGNRPKIPQHTRRISTFTPDEILKAAIVLVAAILFSIICIALFR